MIQLKKKGKKSKELCDKNNTFEITINKAHSDSLNEDIKDI